GGRGRVQHPQGGDPHGSGGAAGRLAAAAGAARPRHAAGAGAPHREDEGDQVQRRVPPAGPEDHRLRRPLTRNRERPRRPSGGGVRVSPGEAPAGAEGGRSGAGHEKLRLTPPPIGRCASWSVAGLGRQAWVVVWYRARRVDVGELSRSPGGGGATGGGAAARWAAARWATVMQAGGEAAATVANGRWTPVAMAKSSLTWRSAIYLASSLALGLGVFIGLAVGLTLSVALVIIWVGLPMLAIMMVAWRGVAMLERQLVRAAFGVRIPSPYRRLPEGRNPLSKLKAMAADPATWKDLVYLALLFPVTLVEFAVSVTVWSATGMLLAMPLIVAASGGAEVGIGFMSYWAGNPVEALPLTLVGLLFLVVAMYVTRVMAIGHSAWARLMLGPNAAQAENLELRKRTEHLRASRARGVDAAEFERR